MPTLCQLIELDTYIDKVRYGKVRYCMMRPYAKADIAASV